jgi:hypothetical protein
MFYPGSGTKQAQKNTQELKDGPRVARDLADINIPKSRSVYYWFGGNVTGLG